MVTLIKSGDFTISLANLSQIFRQNPHYLAYDTGDACELTKVQAKVYEACTQQEQNFANFKKNLDKYFSKCKYK